MRTLLVAPLLQALNFKRQSRILAVDRAQDFPIVQGIAERCLFFVKVRPGDDRVDQVALVLHQTQRAFKMRLSGMLIQRLAQNVHALVQVRLAFDLAIHGSDESGEFLPLVLLDVVFQGLKDGVVRVLDQVRLAGSHGPG